MAEGRSRETWNQTAQLCAMLYNTRAFGKGGKSPSEFNPYTAIDRKKREAKRGKKPGDFGKVITVLTGTNEEAKAALKGLEDG